jgi:hypothetical protein
MKNISHATMAFMAWTEHLRFGLKCFIGVDFLSLSATMNDKKHEREIERYLFKKSEALMNMDQSEETVDHHGATASSQTTSITATKRVRPFCFKVSALRKTAGFFVVLCLISSFFVAPRFCAAADSTSDIIAYQSPYTWRTDGTGDFLLPVIAEKLEYTSQPVSVKGTIMSVTATWEATGPVAVFVSADAGLHYMPVVNGVPVTSGFIKGQTLKWKAVLGADTALSALALAFTSTNGVAGPFGEPELSGFVYRKSLKVSGSPSGTLYRYQVKVRVGESSGVKDADVVVNGHTVADFNDIRFTLADGRTLAPHALVSLEGKKPKRIATYFVRVAQIPQDGAVLFIYYGQPSARSLSSPEDTFDFYEDFTALDGKIDPEKWSLTLGTGGSAQVTPEGLLLDAATLTSKTFEFKDGIIEYVASAETGFETRLVARDPDPQSATDVLLVAYASALDGAQHCLVVDNIVKVNTPQAIKAATYYGYRLLADKENNLTFERFDESFLEKQAEVFYRDTQGPSKGFLALKTAGSGLGRSLTKFQWIRSRQYTAIEPVVDPASAGAEEAPSLPIFSNVVLDNKGDIVLAGAAKTGQYTIPPVQSNFDIRILIPVWKGQGVSVDMSADGGKNYKKNGVSDATYYVSKGDFMPGRVLQGRLNFKKEGDNVPYAEYAAFSYKPGSIVLLGPNGGQTSAGATVPITWTAWDYEPSYPMLLERSLDEGKSFVAIDKAVANTGSYAWKIPAKQAMVTKKALVRISDSFDPQVFDVSDKPFIIAKPLLNVAGGGTGTVVTEETPEEESAGAVSEESAEEETAAAGEEEEGAGEEAEEEEETSSEPQLYDVVIMPRNNTLDDPEEDKGSYKKGDIVMIVPAGHNWSQTERRSFVIVQASLTSKEIRELLQPKEESSQDAKGRISKNKTGRRQFRVDVTDKRISKVTQVSLQKVDIKPLLKDKAVAGEVFQNEPVEAAESPEDKTAEPVTGKNGILDYLKGLLNKGK